ncbi:MAG: GNAT family N-acetyltransferase [Parachlamydiales bacterium]
MKSAFQALRPICYVAKPSDSPGELASRLFLKEVNGEVVSHSVFFECPILVEGQWHKMGALHAICTQSAHREQGLASQLIQEALIWAKDRCDFIILFTEIPKFYERLSFHSIQEYRLHLPYKRSKGSAFLRPVISPNDDALFLRCFQEREPVSNHLWVKDNGAIASFNTLFTTFPTYWSLYYSPAINGFISYLIEDKTFHLLDIVAAKMPSLDLILDHLPAAIEEIYFYFSPDRFTDAAVPEPYLYDKGHLMIYGPWSNTKPFMISPLSRC